MKKILIIIASVCFLFSCKKEDIVTNEPISITITNQLFRVDSHTYSNLDSTLFNFYKNQKDSIPFYSGYSDSNGIITILLNKNNDYYVSLKSKTFGSSGNTHHYSRSRIWFNSTHEKKENVFTAADFVIYFYGSPSISGYDKSNGQGSTHIITQDPF